MIENNIKDSIENLLTILASVPKRTVPPLVIQRIENLRKQDFSQYISEYKAEAAKLSQRN
jgi:hypothetical protein